MENTELRPVYVTFAGIQSEVVKTTYPAGGGTALLLLDANDGSPVLTASINVAGASETLPAEQVVLKTYSEQEGLIEVLGEAGIVEDTGSRVRTGFVQSPVVRIIREIPDYS